MWPKMLGGGAGGRTGKPPYLGRSPQSPRCRPPSLWPGPHLHCGGVTQLFPAGPPWAQTATGYGLRPTSQARAAGLGPRPGSAPHQPVCFWSSLCDLPESFTGAKADDNNSQLESGKGQRPRASPGVSVPPLHRPSVSLNVDTVALPRGWGDREHWAAEAKGQVCGRGGSEGGEEPGPWAAPPQPASAVTHVMTSVSSPGSLSSPSTNTEVLVKLCVLQLRPSSTLNLPGEGMWPSAGQAGALTASRTGRPAGPRSSPVSWPQRGPYFTLSWKGTGATCQH